MRSAESGTQIGLIQVYTGGGKGKTTAALGLALRAAGRGMRTYFGQFLKGTRCSELEAVTLLAPQVALEQYGLSAWVQAGTVTPEQRAAAAAGLARAREALLSGQYDIVVLDEINVAMDLGVLGQDQVLGLIAIKPPHVELVLTGRGAPQAILDAADLVTEMREVRHPFQRGIPARPGIDY